MRRIIMGSCVAMLALVLPGRAATPQEPAPGPDVRKLGYYAGTWRGEGEAIPGPFGPGGKLSSTATCEWFAGGFQLVCRGEETGPSGTRAYLNIRAWDPAAKAYTEYGISSFGESEYDTGGSIVDGRKTFLVSTRLEGKAARIRYTEVQVSPTFYTYLAEASVDGGPWNVIARGRVTKVK